MTRTRLMWRGGSTGSRPTRLPVDSAKPRKSCCTASVHLSPKYKLYLKGGLLMGLAHDSPRQTTDIDLTAGFDAEPGIGERIADALGATFRSVAAELGYPALTVNIHSIKALPPGSFDTAHFPAVKIKVVHTVRVADENVHPLYFDIDISFNEPLQQVRVLRIAEGRELYA